MSSTLTTHAICLTLLHYSTLPLGISNLIERAKEKGIRLPDSSARTAIDQLIEDELVKRSTKRSRKGPNLRMTFSLTALGEGRFREDRWKHIALYNIIDQEQEADVIDDLSGKGY